MNPKFLIPAALAYLSSCAVLQVTYDESIERNGLGAEITQYQGELVVSVRDLGGHILRGVYQIQNFTPLESRFDDVDEDGTFELVIQGRERDIIFGILQDKLEILN